jgi:hypothetical protein
MSPMSRNTRTHQHHRSSCGRPTSGATRVADFAAAIIVGRQADTPEPDLDYFVADPKRPLGVA